MNVTKKKFHLVLNDSSTTPQGYNPKDSVYVSYETEKEMKYVHERVVNVFTGKDQLKEIIVHLLDLIPGKNGGKDRSKVFKYTAGRIDVLGLNGDIDPGEDIVGEIVNLS